MCISHYFILTEILAKETSSAFMYVCMFDKAIDNMYTHTHTQHNKQTHTTHIQHTHIQAYKGEDKHTHR